MRLPPLLPSLSSALRISFGAFPSLYRPSQRTSITIAWDLSMADATVASHPLNQMVPSAEDG